MIDLVPPGEDRRVAGRHGPPRRRGRLPLAGAVVVALALALAGVAVWPWDATRAPTGSAQPDPVDRWDSEPLPDRGAQRPSRGGNPRADRPRTSPAPVEPDDERAGTPAGPEPAPPAGAAVVETGSCGASFYGEPQPTASGEPFDPEALTAAHLSWAFDTRVRVTNPATGQSVVVRINDRGPYVEDRCLDLSRGAFREIADLDAGVITVTYEVLAD